VGAGVRLQKQETIDGGVKALTDFLKEDHDRT